MSDPRRTQSDPPSEYYYRRRLTMRELLPAIGAAVGTAAAAFYLTKLFLERTPLVRPEDRAVPASRPRRRSTPVIVERA